MENGWHMGYMRTMVNHQSGTQFRYHILELDASGDYLNNFIKDLIFPITRAITL